MPKNKPPKKPIKKETHQAVLKAGQKPTPQKAPLGNLKGATQSSTLGNLRNAALGNLARDASRQATEIKRSLDRSIESMEQTAQTMRQGLTFARGRQQQLERFRDTNLLNNLLDNPVFQGLQRQFFTALLPIPGGIYNVLLAFHDSLTPDQKEELSEIGKMFASLPFEFLTGQISAEECYQKTVEGLERLVDFFVDLAESYIENPENLVKIADIVLKSCGPLGDFLSMAMHVVVQSALSEDFKQPLERGIRGTTSALNNLEGTLRNIISRGLGFDPIDNPIYQGLEMALAPISTGIKDILESFRGILNQDQKEVLAEIGKTFATLPLAFLTGEISPEAFYEKTVEALENLKDFIIDFAETYVGDPENLKELASNILESCGDLGKFLSQAFKQITESSLEESLKQPMEQAIQGITSVFEGLQDTLTNIISQGLGFRPNLDRE